MTAGAPARHTPSTPDSGNLDHPAIPASQPDQHARPIAVTHPDDHVEQRPERTVTTDVVAQETVLTVDPGYGGIQCESARAEPESCSTMQ